MVFQWVGEGAEKLGKKETFIHIPITETVKSLHRMGQLPPQVSSLAIV